MVSIDRVLPSVAAAVGAAGFVDHIGLPESRSAVVLVIDGLGERQLRDYGSEAPFLASCTSVGPGRSAIPSTTATSLTSLGTGLRAGEHGIVGYSMRVPATGRRLNVLKWDQPVDPLDFQPHRPVLAALAESDIVTAVVNDSRFAESGLTACSQARVPFVGFDSPWQRLDCVVDLAEAAQRSLVYTYESRLDHAGHGHGMGSPEWLAALREIDDEAMRLRRELPDDTLLVITADHGMVNLPAAGRFDIDDHPELMSGVSLFAGEARFRHLYADDPAAVAGRWRRVLGERADIRLRDEANEWFGPIAPGVAPRIGEVVVAALGTFAVFSRRQFAVELKLKGFHGSISDEETAIPLVIA